MIKFLDVKRINSVYQTQFIEDFTKAMESGTYISGQKLIQFEQEFSNFVGATNTIGVGNGLDALRLIFRGLKQQKKISLGDSILVPNNTFIASIIAIIEEGLVPILCPTNDEFLLTFDKLDDFVRSDTRGVLLVHLYGNLKGVERVKQFCDSKEILLIEDAAQSHGASLKNRSAGNWGVAAAFSFYPGKNLGALGDGGAVTTSDPELASIIRSMSNYGYSKRYFADYEGLNSRLDELQAAFLSTKLHDLHVLNSNRQRISHIYFDKINNPKILLPPRHDLEDEHVWHLFVVRTQNALDLQDYLTTREIETAFHYPISITKQKCYQNRSFHGEAYAESGLILSLPIDPLMTIADAELVALACNDY